MERISAQYPHRNDDGNQKEIERWIRKLEGGFPPYLKMNEFERETIKMILEAIYLPSSAQDLPLQYQMIFTRLNTISNESVGIIWGLLFGFLSELIEENYQKENEIEILRTKIANI